MPDTVPASKSRTHCPCVQVWSTVLVQSHISESHFSHQIYHTDTTETSSRRMRWHDFSQAKSCTVVMTPFKMPSRVFLQTNKSSLRASKHVEYFCQVDFLGILNHGLLDPIIPASPLPHLCCITRCALLCKSTHHKNIFQWCYQWSEPLQGFFELFDYSQTSCGWFCPVL